MCWEGERNGSEDFEETWNGRMVVNMEKLQWRIVVFFYKKESKMMIKYVDCNGIFFRQ